MFAKENNISNLNINICWNNVSSMLKETGKAKNDPEKNFEGDFKKMELTWGTGEREKKKREFHGEKRSGCIILNG